jgi:hypothetical protein
MSRRHVAAIAFALVAPVLASAAQSARPPATPPARTPLSKSDLTARAGSSVVTIHTSSGHGAGVILDSTGLVVTSLQVVRGQTGLSIRLANGDVYDDVGVVDVDERRDLVLLKIKAFGLAPATLGDSEKVAAGQRVMLVGSPQAPDAAIAETSIKEVRRSGQGYRLIQTAAATSANRLGGGMFNEFGELVGVIAARPDGGADLTAGIPVNYARGLASTTVRMTLEELAIKVANSPSGQGPRSIYAGTPPTAAGARLQALLAASKIAWTRTSEYEWKATYKGVKVPELTVEARVADTLLVLECVAKENATLDDAAKGQLLQMNYGMDLVKVAVRFDDSVVVMMEIELRLLDAPGLVRLADEVAREADRVATALAGLGGSAPPPPSIKEETAPDLSAPADLQRLTRVELLQGRAEVRFDRLMWRPQVSSEPTTSSFQHHTGDLHLQILSERLEVPLANMADVALANMTNGGAQNAKVVRRGYRNVNGQRMLFLELESTMTGVAFSFYGHYWSGPSGTVQIVGFAGRSLIGEYRGAIESFVSTFQVLK